MLIYPGDVGGRQERIVESCSIIFASSPGVHTGPRARQGTVSITSLLCL